MVVGRVVGDAVLIHVVEIGADRQSCDPSTTLLFKLVLEVVLGVVGCLHGKDDVHRKRPIPLKSPD
jgi:hypothetical protein